MRERPPGSRSHSGPPHVDNDIIEAFRLRAEARGIGYQTAINEALRAALDDEVPLTAAKLREVLRQDCVGAAEHPGALGSCFVHLIEIRRIPASRLGSCIYMAFCLYR